MLLVFAFGILWFCVLMLFGGSRGPKWFDYRKPLEDRDATWKILVGWPAVRTIGLSLFGWFLISRGFGGTVALEAVGLAIVGWIAASVLAAAFEASKPGD